MVQVFQIRVCITTFLFISTFNNVRSIVDIYNIGTNAINRASYVKPFSYLTMFSYVSLISILSLSSRAFLFLATIKKVLGTSAINAFDCSAASV